MTLRGRNCDESLHGHDKLLEAAATRPCLEMKRAGDLAHSATVQHPHFEKNPLIRTQLGKSPFKDRRKQVPSFVSRPSQLYFGHERTNHGIAVEMCRRLNHSTRRRTGIKKFFEPSEKLSWAQDWLVTTADPR